MRLLFENDHLLMRVTESGMVTFVRLLSENAHFPIEVIELE